MKKHKFVYDDSKASWDGFWKKPESISVERAWGGITKCITSKFSGQHGASAGSRESIVLDAALELYKKHFISEHHLSINSNALIVMCVFLSHKKWNPSDIEPSKTLDLRKGSNSDQDELKVLQQNVKKLDAFLSKLVKMNGEEFFQYACEGKHKANKDVFTLVPSTLLRYIRKSQKKGEKITSHINQTIRRNRI